MCKEEKLQRYILIFENRIREKNGLESSAIFLVFLSEFCYSDVRITEEIPSVDKLKWNSVGSWVTTPKYHLSQT